MRKEIYFNFLTAGCTLGLFASLSFVVFVGSSSGASSRPSSLPSQDNSDASIAISYADAKFAYCSTQGLGTLIDFNGADLSKSGQGTAKIGIKECGSNDPIAWRSEPFYFTVTVTDDVPQILFEGSNADSYIQPHSYQTGLWNGQGAPAEISGNSGECFFIENSGIENLPFVYSCN